MNEQKVLKEEDDRILDIIRLLKDDDFTNISKRLKFATLIVELITSSSDIRVRRLIKKLGDAIKEFELEDEKLNENIKKDCFSCHSIEEKYVLKYNESFEVQEYKGES